MKLRQGNISTGVCHSAHRGVCMAGGHAWWGHTWQGALWQRGHVWQGACVVGACMAGGMHGGGCAWQGAGKAGEIATTAGILECILAFIFKLT